MKNAIRPVAAVVCMSALFCAHAVNFMLKNGKTDWTDPNSYTNNAVPSSSSDCIFTESNATNELLSSDLKYTDSLAIINTVGDVKIGNHAVLVIEVPSGSTNTITGRIGSENTTATLVKKGGGTLLQEPSQVPSNYYVCRWRVEAGTLGAPLSGNTTVAKQNIYCRGIEILFGAKLILPYQQLFQVSGPFTGAGDVITLNPNSTYETCSPLYLKGGPGELSGSISSNVYIYVRDGIQSFTGTENRYNCGLIVSGFKDDGTDKGVLGFVKFGANNTDPSSLGMCGNVTLGEDYSNGTLLAGALRYLGTTGESVTGKNIIFGYTQDAPTTFDAGAHGGLSFSSDIAWTVSDAKNQRLCLTGSNIVECVFAGRIRELSRGSVYLIKKGSGAWHLKNHTNSELSGPVRIEDGVLRHDTLTSRGANCALGSATNLHDGAYVAPADATGVDYSILFSGAGNGILEFSGKYDGCSTNRNVAVKSGGCLSSSDGAVRIHGISAYDSPETATLTILATNSAISTYADITDGTHGGKLGVTKRGGGTTELDGELSFSGPLNVEGGRLIVRNSSGRYTWFRLTIKENYCVQQGTVTSSANTNHVVVERFALYDADGVRQNIGFTRRAGNVDEDGNGASGYAVKSVAGGLRPGEIALDRPGKVYVWKNSDSGRGRDIQNICDADDSSLVGSYVQYNDGAPLSP